MVIEGKKTANWGENEKDIFLCSPIFFMFSPHAESLLACSL